jgi:putative chitinase
MQNHKKNKSVTSASTNRRSIRMRQLENTNSFSMSTSSIPVEEYRMLTAEQFADLFPNAEDPQSWVDSMNNVFPKYEINTPNRIAAFLAQCGYESGGWNVFEENLNYSAERLMVIFIKYFPTKELANDYARQPQKIANRVYGGRLGNGPEESGDGWLYRGRGPIQLTGKNNYREFAKYMFKENLIEDEEKILNNPNLVAATATADRKFALMSAIWFWNKENLNVQADAGNLKTMTDKINGGLNGLTDRIELYDKAIRLLNG